MVNEIKYPRVAKYYNEKFRSYVMKAHFHDEDEVMYVVSGNAILRAMTKNLTHGTKLR